MDHYFFESWTTHPGPAHAWLSDNTIHPILMLPMQRKACDNPSMAERVLEKPLGRFSVLWSSKAVFFTRVRVFLNYLVLLHDDEALKTLVTKYLPEEDSCLVTASV